MDLVIPNQMEIFRYRDACYYLRKREYSPNPKAFLDTLGSAWGLVLGHQPPKASWASIWREGELYQYQGDVAIFLPPFSLVEWHMACGIHDIEILCSRAPLPSTFPKEPVGFRTDRREMPASVGEVFDMIEKNRHAWSPIERTNKLNAMARRTRQAICSGFLEEFSCSELAKELRYNVSLMSRTFAHCYGLSPVQYKIRLRAYEAMEHLLESNATIAKCAFESGFTSLGLFNRQFRREMGMTPTELRKQYRMNAEGRL